MIRFEFSSADFQRRFGAIVASARNPVPVLMGAGREVANRLKTHFRKRDKQSPNHLSERRTHFWLQVAQSVSSPAPTGPNSVSVTISDPRFAQKVFGGRITAKRAGALTIPVEERAYGRTAATFERETGLKLFLVHSGGSKANPFVNAVLAVKEGRGLTVEYVLANSVDQQADPEALPLKADLERAVLGRAQKVLDRQIKSV